MPPSERLGTPTTGVEARDSYATSYYDAASRLVAQANFGTTSISAPAPTDSVPTRSDSVLVLNLTYNAAGEAETTTDRAASSPRRSTTCWVEQPRQLQRH